MFLSESTPSPTNSMPFFEYSLCSADSDGISSTHGPHHDAQKLITTGCPLKRASDCGAPSALVTLAAHSCLTALLSAGAAFATPARSLLPSSQWPATAPPAVATTATAAIARIRFI